MSSDSDRVAFDESVSAQDNTVLFQQKRWTYITDTSSQNGQFSGQLQFDLNTLSSQNQWTDLSQAYIQFPVKLSIKNTGAGAQTPALCDAFAATIKNGFHQFVDSVSIVLGGANIQSSQIFENVNATYKMLSEFSSEELRKYGPSLGLALDDFVLPSDTTPTTAAGGLDNVQVGTLIPAVRGTVLPVATNAGFKERAHMYNGIFNGASGSILGTNAAVIGKSRVAVDADAVSLNDDAFVLFALGTIRLKDVSDALAKIPLVKGMKGFIYVNYNAATSQFVLNGSNVYTSATNTATFGRCMPAMLGSFTPATAAAGTWTFTAEISGTPSASLSSVSPPFNNARLFAPYYIANPEVDRTLSTRKTIRYHERFVSTFEIGPNSNFTGTLTSGITNPKRVILLPTFKADGANTVSNIPNNPLLSPWSHEGTGGSSPFAALKDLQITVGGQPMWQGPVSFDYENFLQEVSQQGLDGGLVSQTGSGLLNQRLWNQLYRYYTCDVSRRMGADDGASKAVQVSCSNATGIRMSVIAMIWYEREITIDTAMGQITQSL